MMAANSEEVIGYRRKMRKIRKVHLILCMIGTLLSCYSVYVEINLENDSNYSALCDIGPGISCTKVFGSEWGKGFGLIKQLAGEDFVLNQPNGVYGVISYPLFILTSRFESLLMAKATLAIGVAGVFISLYLGYVLFYILSDICVICISIYSINIILFVLSSLYYYYMSSLFDILKRTSTPAKVEVKKYV